LISSKSRRPPRGLPAAAILSWDLFTVGWRLPARELKARLHNRLWSIIYVLKRKINLSDQETPKIKTNMKTWAIVVGVLIVLFCLSYLVRHPNTVDQTFAKVFPHNGAETP
jgi:hypothetical protein